MKNMKLSKSIVKRTGVVFLAVCLFLTSGCFADFFESLAKRLSDTFTAKAADAGTYSPIWIDSATPTPYEKDNATWYPYPLYNFAEDTAHSGTFYRLDRTVIYVKGCATYATCSETYKGGKNGNNNPVSSDTYVAEAYKFGTITAKRGYVSGTDDPQPALVTFEYTYFDDFVPNPDEPKNYYKITPLLEDGVPRVQYFNFKIGGTSGGWLFMDNGNAESSGNVFYDTFKNNGYKDPDVHSFHRDYYITFYDTDKQPLYNYLKIGDKYYRLQKQDEGMFSAKISYMGSSGTVNKETFPYWVADYDFSALLESETGIIIDGQPYYFWNGEGEPRGENYITVDTTQKPDVTISDTLCHDGGWYGTTSAWMDGSSADDWGPATTNPKTKSFHRDFVAVLHNSETEYTVTYKDGSNVLHAETVKSGNKPVYSATPEKEGYVFTGWKNSSGTVYTNVSDMPKVYSDVTYEAVYKKKVTITAKSAAKIYDGTALTAGGYTASGQEADDTHTFVVTMTADSTITDAGIVSNVIATVDGVAVVTGEEIEVGDYFVTTVNGKLEIKPRTVILVSESAEKPYDGTPLTKPEVTVSGDGFVDGEVGDIKATGSVTTLVDGEVKNTIIYTEGAAFKASNYNITKNEGKLKITSNTKAIKITSSTKSWPYDGEMHKDETYTVTYEGAEVEADETGKGFTLPTGDVLTITGTAEGVTDYSENYSGNNTFTYELQNSSCYTSVTKEFGTLSIDKCKVTVTITGNSDTVGYDGEEQSIEGYKFESSNELYTEDDVAFSGEAVAAGTNAGSYEMGLSEDDFANTNDNFDVTFEVTEDGVLTIEPKEVAIEWTGTEFPYDGKEHAPTATITNLADGDKCVVTVDGAGTEIGEYTATAKELSNKNYKLPEKCSASFEIYGCTVTFVDGDGKTLQSGVVPFGEKPEYKGGTPTKKATDKYTYTFNGKWSPELAEVTQKETTYTAQFTETEIEVEPEKEYALMSVKYGDGTAPKTGETPSHTKESGVSVIFEIKGNVDDDSTYTHFLGLAENGKDVATGSYKKTKGSVIIELLPAYLDTLSAGEHTFTAKFDDTDDGVELKVLVAEKQTEPDDPTEPTEPDIPSPKTADTMNVIVIIAVIGVMCAILVLVRRKKEKEDE